MWRKQGFCVNQLRHLFYDGDKCQRKKDGKCVYKHPSKDEAKRALRKGKPGKGGSKKTSESKKKKRKSRR